MPDALRQGDRLGNSWRIAGDGTNWGALSNCANENAALQVRYSCGSLSSWYECGWLVDGWVMVGGCVVVVCVVVVCGGGMRLRVRAGLCAGREWDDGRGSRRG